ncbi:COG4280 domain-containing protein [Alicyclobacillus sp. SO9]|uniref:COG4280 domain-containing protein n=1 Tax=Alicyclobacillus sp. SO9 TaxID=2665646 RepID=UPI0018E8D571|nr:hypothetical protein [Alicyclobacillus sp. SO9]QQE77590.1 hypothetical protein GI364_16815 [Alicyclobacillus sp. SO9]
MFHSYASLASFLGASVEFIEALTIVLAVGTIRGWKSALSGALTAVVILGALVAIVGTPLVLVVQIPWVSLLIGLFILLFGIRWLRKSILRYSGLKALHNEAQSYEREVERQKQAVPSTSGIDKFAFVTAFSGTFLEGLEAVFIVITIGLSTNNMKYAVWGAASALILVALVGLLLRSPLTRIPENTMKFVVGIMLTSFGAFWVGEGLKVKWPQQDLSILYIAATLFILSSILITRCRTKLSTTVTGQQGSIEG